MDRFFANYPNCVCRECEKRTVNSENKVPDFNTFFDSGDNPIFIDGIKCWRRYKFGGFVTMRDLHDCSTLEEFYRKAYNRNREERFNESASKAARRGPREIETGTDTEEVQSSRSVEVVQSISARR